MFSSKVCALVIAALATAASAGTAQATTITQADLTQGQSSVTPVGSGFTVTTTGNSGASFFDHKTGGSPSATGVGVGGTGSVVAGEIDNNESITFTSNTGQHLLSSFDVAFLYSQGFQMDNVFEIALLGLTGPASTITVTVTSPTTATLSGAFGSVTNESAGDNTGAGEWLVQFTTPVLFTNLVFEPGDGGTSSAQGDFAFVNMTFSSAVPEASTWAMMILGFMGVGFLAYRRRGNGPVMRLV
jgi:hypothetical protein